MALKPNASMVFTRYEIERDGVVLWFVCPDPGAGEPSDYAIYFTNAELAAVTDLASFQTACLTKLKRVYRAEGIATRLDGLIGRTLTLP